MKDVLPWLLTKFNIQRSWAEAGGDGKRIIFDGQSTSSEQQDHRSSNSMGEKTPLTLTGSQLFQLCAENSGDDEYWRLFVARFNPLLVRSLTVAWQRHCQGAYPPREAATELLQDIYLLILKDDCRLLRQFRGASDAEADAYLAHTTINKTISYLRAKGAQMRQAIELSLEGMMAENNQEIQQAASTSRPRLSLSEKEMIELLQKHLTGPHSRRDILLFLLHFRDGWTVREIADMRVCEMKETSIANLLTQMKGKVKNFISLK